MEIKSSNKDSVIVNFGDTINSVEWRVVNDDVMGGVSRSKVNINPEGYMLFDGNVSLDYGGGLRVHPSGPGKLLYDPVAGQE